MRRHALPIAFAMSCLAAGCATAPRHMQVNVPLLDVRSQPHTQAQPGGHDAQQETQLFYGEPVEVKRRQDGWALIEAPEQPEFSHQKRWQGYPGWVPEPSLIHPTYQLSPTIVVRIPWAPSFEDPHLQAKSAMAFPLGARLRAVDIAGVQWRVELADGGFVWLPRDSALSLRDLSRLSAAQRRPLILAAAAQLLGTPYYWGGRSAQAGFDCSGLVNVSYRVAGVDVPRDAHEQSLRARVLGAPQPADLIFLSESENPRRIVHVMLYAGGEEVLEAPGTGLKVRRITLRERLGKTLAELPAGTVIKGQTITFGTYLE